MGKVSLHLFIVLALVSCNKDSPPEESVEDICHEINIDWHFSSCSVNDSLKLNINSDGKYELAFYLFSSCGGFGEYYKSRFIKPKNGFEVAFLNVSEIWWFSQFDSTQQDFDTISQSAAYYTAAQKFSINDTVFINDLNFTFDKTYITYTYVWAYSPDPFPFQTGLTTTNSWTKNGQGFIVFRNQNTGVMGWIKMNLYGSPSIITSHYEITDTLIVDETVCQ